MQTLAELTIDIVAISLGLYFSRRRDRGGRTESTTNLQYTGSSKRTKGPKGRCSSRGHCAHQEGDDKTRRPCHSLRRQRLCPPQQQEGTARDTSQWSRRQRAPSCWVGKDRKLGAQGHLICNRPDLPPQTLSSKSMLRCGHKQACAAWSLLYRPDLTPSPSHCTFSTAHSSNILSSATLVADCSLWPQSVGLVEMWVFPKPPMLKAYPLKATVAGFRDPNASTLEQGPSTSTPHRILTAVMVPNHRQDSE